MKQVFASGGQSIGASVSASVLNNEYSGLISFRIDWFGIFAVQGTLRSLLQHHSSKASILQCSAMVNSWVVLVVKNLPAKARDTGDLGLIPGSGRSPGGGNGNTLQYSCLENPTDRGALKAMVHRVTKSWTQLKQLSTHMCACTHTHIYILGWCTLKDGDPPL